MIILAYDTETTGLPLWGERSHDPRQPHLVELAWILYDDQAERELACESHLILPAGWSFDEGAVAVHKITEEYALLHGIPELRAVEGFFSAWGNSADVVVGHNEQFDARMLRIAAARYEPDLCDAWKNRIAICTQALATPIVKAPPTKKMLAAGRTHHKTASLNDAYKHITGNDLDGAHSALADARACLQVYLALREKTEKDPFEAKPAASNKDDSDMPGFL